MVTDQRLFAGETVSATSAAVLALEPDWGALPAAAPGSVRVLLCYVLVREPKRR